MICKNCGIPMIGHLLFEPNENEKERCKKKKYLFCKRCNSGTKPSRLNENDLDFEGEMFKAANKYR